MIAPTGRLILLAAAGAPPALLLGLFRPEWWVAALESVSGKLILGRRLEVGELEQVTKQNPFS